MSTPFHPTRARSFSSSSTATTTITLEIPSSSTHPNQLQQQQRQPEALFLPLRRKKKVSWKEGTVDNEFMNKKSSKKCCIFHKQKPFDEDDSEDEDGNPDPSDKHSHDRCCGDDKSHHDDAGPSGCKE